MLTIIYKIKLCILIFSISLFINPFLAKAQNKDRNLTLKGRNINKFDGFIALGCIIKGQTPHFDLLCSSLFNSILSLSIKYNKPIGNGVITALNLNQAKQRSKKTKSVKPNKGAEAANAVISIFKNGTTKI